MQVKYLEIIDLQYSNKNCDVRLVEKIIRIMVINIVDHRTAYDSSF
jgi:hypothetical protein